MRARPEPLSELADADAAVAGGDFQQRSAAIQLAANARPLDGPAHRNRHVQLDMPVASMGVKLGGKIWREPNLQLAVDGVNQPSIAHLRSRPHREVNVPIAGTQVNVSQHAVNGHVSIASVGVQSAIEVADLNVSVAGIDAGLPGDAIDCDVSIARVQV